MLGNTEDIFKRKILPEPNFTVYTYLQGDTDIAVWPHATLPAGHFTASVVTGGDAECYSVEDHMTSGQVAVKHHAGPLSWQISLLFPSVLFQSQ